MTDKKSDEPSGSAPAATTPALTKPKPPSAWAEELGTDPGSYAGLMIFHKWDREPSKLVTKEAFEKAVAAFENLTFGDTETKPAKAKGA